MIRFLDQLYYTDEMEGRIQRIRENLLLNQEAEHACYLVISANPKDVLEVLSSTMLMQEIRSGRKMDVVGLAGDREAAFHLVTVIFKDLLSEHGLSTGMRDLLCSKFERHEE